MPREPDDIPDEALASVLTDEGHTPDEERRRMREAGLRMVLRGDADYPPLLTAIADAPRALWVRGDLAALGALPVAIVGARRATAYGIAQAGRFASHLVGEGVAIVSGGARGIDAEAHRAALRMGGSTVAVVGCGLGAGPYPPEHGGLYRAIVEAGGALVSELPTRYPVLTHNFPRRNRIISGLSVAVVVIEAGVTSGALITARMAVGEHNRQAFAIPGPVDSPRSEGCNRAILEGEAAMVLAPQQVMDELAGAGALLAGACRARSAPRSGPPPAVQAAMAAVRAARRRERTADSARLVEVTGLPAHEVQAALTFIEIEGRGCAPAG